MKTKTSNPVNAKAVPAAEVGSGVRFDSTPKDHSIILDIAVRAAAFANTLGIAYGLQAAAMDVTAVHLNGCPLDLPRLLRADDTNFGHDILGIRGHLDRSTANTEAPKG